MGRKTVIVFDLLALVLGLAATAYLLYALVKPERF
ncbi:potassium-transporting ATPase subunit F [Arthrobacter sp. I2-34]|uniref:Potassium-transporting ATPase subunit F n=1 Tax=Arthrobacter hankyongi TaxID=2904801 RepID=A0ABS9LAD1_9MICC|nr:potassium-transporting ATPase subunit F [Arthrobacter hankyongi]MCG2623637.1 potassium-transporting ATPase subunit F [Arthrobacter hankyongi]